MFQSLDEYLPFFGENSLKSIEIDVEEEEWEAILSEGKKIKEDRRYTNWIKNENLCSLGQKIDDFKKLGFNHGFLKVNDYTMKGSFDLDRWKIRKIFHSLMSNCEDRKSEFKNESNRKVCCLFNSFSQTMKISNGISDGIHLLVHSERTIDEIEGYKKGLSKKPKLIVQEFGYIDAQYEFIAFVFKKKFTCLSQLHTHCYFPELVRRKNDVEMIVKKFIDEVFGNEKVMSLGSFILTISVANDQVKVLKMDPFCEIFGNCLFDWSIMSDYKILGGMSDFEFRIRDKPVFIGERDEEGWFRVVSDEGFASEM